MNTARQRLQCALYDTPFALELSKRIIRSKLKNQAVVLRRYEKSRQTTVVGEQLKMLHICRDKIEQCETVSEIMGYEGQGAKAYFNGLSRLVIPEFKFHGRNKRPLRDELYVGADDSIKVYMIIGKGQVTSFGKSMDCEQEDIIVI